MFLVRESLLKRQSGNFTPRKKTRKSKNVVFKGYGICLPCSHILQNDVCSVFKGYKMCLNFLKLCYVHSEVKLTVCVPDMCAVLSVDKKSAYDHLLPVLVPSVCLDSINCFVLFFLFRAM